jgi:hypothetical protein
VVATELVTTSISSGGDGSDSRDEIDAALPFVSSPVCAQPGHCAHR